MIMKGTSGIEEFDL